MSGPDLVGDAPALGSAPPARRRGSRRWAVGATAAVALVAAVLAARSAPDPLPAAPTPPAPILPTAADPGLPIVDLAVGDQAAYALLGACAGPAQARTCSYRLQQRSAGGRWRVRPLPTGPLDTAGFAARLFVTADDGVTVLDESGGDLVYLGAADGVGFAVRRLRTGPAVPAVPTDGILDLGLCDRCGRRLTVLERATGLLRPLAGQPPLGPGALLRSVAVRGDVVWAVGEADGSVRTAVSTDRGRSWAVRPLPGLRPQPRSLRVAVTGSGEAFLVVGRDSRPDVVDEFSELWHVDGPTGSWRRQTPDAGPGSVLSVLAGDRGLLVSDESGVLWRRQPDGSMSRLPDAVVDGRPHGPGRLAAGPGRLLLGVPVDGPTRQTVVVSSDEGDSWLAEELPG